MKPYGRCIVCHEIMEDEYDEKNNYKHLGDPDSVYDKDGNLKKELD